jgi:tryptophanyl-tRNA synthetase
LPGLDGRKMSKSYDNTIPLFSSREQLKKLIAGIKTDSRAPGEPKDTEGSALFQIYQAFATEDETEALRKAYAEGIAWGDAKTILFERIDREIAPMRAAYEDYMAHPEKVEALLLAGAAKARAIATPLMTTLRSAVGLRSLSTAAQSTEPKSSKVALASFKQYREKDGQFYFKLVDTAGAVLLQSKGFESPKVAGQAIAQLQRDGAAALSALQSNLEPMGDAAQAAVDQALAALAQAAEKA